MRAGGDFWHGVRVVRHVAMISPKFAMQAAFEGQAARPPLPPEAAARVRRRQVGLRPPRRGPLSRRGGPILRGLRGVYRRRRPRRGRHGRPRRRAEAGHRRRGRQVQRQPGRGRQCCQVCRVA